MPRLSPATRSGGSIQTQCPAANRQSQFRERGSNAQTRPNRKPESAARSNSAPYLHPLHEISDQHLNTLLRSPESNSRIPARGKTTFNHTESICDVVARHYSPASSGSSSRQRVTLPSARVTPFYSPASSGSSSSESAAPVGMGVPGRIEFARMAFSISAAISGCSPR